MKPEKIHWRESVCSEVNRDFVSNPYPKRCQCINISMRTGKDAPVSDVWLRGMSDGVSFRIKMDRTSSGIRFQYYAVDVEVGRYTLAYRFEMKATSGEYVYYTSRGCQSVPPTEDADFVIIAAFSNPAWVPGAVFYQIFPDRFKNGNPEIGIRDNEYLFDGASTQVLSWDEKPPEYDEGRCLDFYNGDLAGIEKAIPHLRDFHIDAVYLNPVFSARTNHRYDCTDYFHVDEHLGGNQALISLMEKLHSCGMHAILDVSINHTGREHPWFQSAEDNPDSDEAGYYYQLSDGSFACWWDVPTLPQLNYGSEKLRGKIWKDTHALVRKFVKPPYQIDGWRFDVAGEVGRRGDDQYCHEIWQEVRKAVKQEKPRAYILGEYWEDAIDYLMGDQWDGAMNYFSSGRPIRSWLGELD
nr:alpha amylase N-terminal ig-like domain-containing protein [Spirochaetales bacterium]